MIELLEKFIKINNKCIYFKTVRFCVLFFVLAARDFVGENARSYAKDLEVTYDTGICLHLSPFLSPSLLLSLHFVRMVNSSFVRAQM